MATMLSVRAVEKSTYIVTTVFTDEADAAVTPLTVTWSLTDADGTVINDRLDVSETPASTVNIVLTGDDLSIPDSTKLIRIVTVEATYDSDYGTGLYLKKAAVFNVENLLSVT